MSCGNCHHSFIEHDGVGCKHSACECKVSSKNFIARNWNADPRIRIPKSYDQYSLLRKPYLYLTIPAIFLIVLSVVLVFWAINGLVLYAYTDIGWGGVLLALFFVYSMFMSTISGVSAFLILMKMPKFGIWFGIGTLLLWLFPALSTQEYRYFVLATIGGMIVSLLIGWRKITSK